MNEENNITSTDDTQQITSTTAAEEGSETTDQGQSSEVQTEGSQSEVGQQEEETFFDPNTVPEELKPAYKQLQAAFTKKTQSIAEERKNIATYKAKAEAYAKYEQYAPILEEMLKGQPNKPETPELKALQDKLKAEGYSDEAIKMMTMSSEFLLNSFNQKQEAEKAQAETAKETVRIQSGIDESAKLDPRLNDQNLVYKTDTGESVTFGEIVENLVLSDTKWKQDPIAATKRAISRVDALIGKAKTQGKEELSNSARQKAKNFAPNGSSPQSTVSDEQPMTIKEAAAKAKKQLGI